MGIRIEVLGNSVEVSDYSVSEDSTPLSGQDTSGGVGTISLTVPIHRTEQSARGPVQRLASLGPGALIGAPVRLADTRRGLTVGKVISVSRGGGTLRLECQTRLADLSIYNVQAGPHVGTLRSAFEAYLALAGVDTDIYIDPSIATRAVAFPGWRGELWFHLKQMCQAQGVEIALVSGLILLRPLRNHDARLSHARAKNVSLGSGSLGLYVDAYCYQAEAISFGKVWPPEGGGNVTNITVNAGDITSFTLELSASLTSIQQPQVQDWVSPSEASASVYSVLTGDGDRITAEEWSRAGGFVRAILSPEGDTVRLIVTAPRGIRVGDREVRSFSLVDFGDWDGARRDTLRLVGSGVRYNKQKYVSATGVSPAETENETRGTIDNPFVSTWADVYRLVSASIMEASGLQTQLSADVATLSRRGETGELTMPTYAEVAASLASAGAVTNADVDAYYASESLITNEDVANFWYEPLRNRFENQAFGNVAGARVYDSDTAAWYRVRETSIQPEGISVGAELDITHADAQAAFSSLSYADMETAYGTMTNRQVIAAGLWWPEG